MNKASFCPACGSPAIDASPLAGGVASCRSCTWKGPTTDLLVHHFQHGFATEEEVLHAFASDVKMLFAKEYGVPILQMLLKWGFMGKPEPKILGKFLMNISTAVFQAVLKTREEIEKGTKSSV